MPTFNNIASTSATPPDTFTYADYRAEIDSAMSAVRTAALSVANDDPISQDISANLASFGYANGSTLEASIVSKTATSATFSHVEIGAADGSILEMTGTATVSLTNGVASAKPAKLTTLAYGNCDSMQFLQGAIAVDILGGSLTGKLTSITIAYSIDDPNTTAHEWSYVKLLGKAAVTGNISQGLGSVTGKLSGVEWGTLTTTDGTATVTGTQMAGSAGGLKMDSGTLFAGLNSGGFDALRAGLYSGNDVINGTAGGDLLNAGAGNDKVYGGDGDDTIDGGLGNDQLFGGAGNDTLIGGAGNDKIADDSGHNVIFDLEGNASIITGWGNDTITTGGGNDKIAAGDGANIITAGAGNDSVVCGAGHDQINGGIGADKLVGGAGADVFVFDNLAVGGKDSIADFNAAEDIFAFDTSVFTALAGGIGADNVVIGKAALDANDYLIVDATGGKLYYDADGNGAGAAILIADVKGALGSIGAANFANLDQVI